MVCVVFQEYVLRIDPVTNLGLSAESVFSYHIGDIVRTKGKITLYYIGLDARKPVFMGVRTTKGQTSLRICAD